MSSNTPNLDLLKKDPITDGADTFNIETMLNENWDKIDDAVGLAMTEATSAKQAGNERKAQVVAALIAKGVQATTSESWDTLIPKIVAIVTATGNAILSDVLAGRTFSTSAGNAMVGTASPKVPNLLKNGSFENGMTSWVLQGLVGDVVTGAVNGSTAKFGVNRLSVTAPASITEGHLVQSLKYVKNHKYYVCGYILTDSLVSMDVYFPLVPPYGVSQFSVGGGNVWKFFSGSISTASIDSQEAFIRFDINNGGATVYAWFDGLMLIDLTESFGAGKEPNQATMDAIVQGAGGWWDNTIETITTNRGAYVNATGVGQWADGSIAGFFPEGYYSGNANNGGAEVKITPTQLQNAYPQIVSPNIRHGVSMFGIPGSFTTDGTITAAQILAGYVGYSQGQRIVGTIPVASEPTTHWSSPQASYGAYSSGDPTTYIYSDIQGMVGKYNSNISWARLPAGDIIPSNFRAGKTAFGGQLVGTMIEGIPIAPGTSIIATGYAGGTAQPNYTFMHGITPSMSGTYRVSFTMEAIFTDDKGYIQIYVNGVPRGVERITSQSATQFSQDITVNAGDEIQLYGRSSNVAVLCSYHTFTLGINFAHTER